MADWEDVPVAGQQPIAASAPTGPGGEPLRQAEDGRWYYRDPNNHYDPVFVEKPGLTPAAAQPQGGGWEDVPHAAPVQAAPSNAERFQPVPTDPNSGVADWTQAIQGPGYEAANRVFNKDLGETLSGIKRTIVRGAHDLVNPADLVSDVKDIGTGIGSAVASGAKYAVQNPTKVPGKVGEFVQDQFVNHPASTLLNLATLGPEGGVGMMGVKGAVGGAADAIGGIAKYPVSVASGLTPKAQGIIANDARLGNNAAVSAMRGSEVADPVEMAQNALSKVAQERQAQYLANKAEWGKDSQTLTHRPILEALENAQKKVMSDQGAFVRDPSALKTIQDMGKIVIEHLQSGETFNPISMDALKQRLGVILENKDMTTLSRNVAKQVYDATRAEIAAKAPNYAKAMEQYSNASTQLNELSRGLSLNPNATKGTTLGKLQTMMRNDVSANYGQRAKLGDVLAKHEPNLLPTLAGQMANSWLARNLVGRMGELGGIAGGVGAAVAAPHLIPAAAAGLAASSPRLVGEAINALNRARRPISAVSGAAGRVAPPVGLLGQQSRGQGLLSP